MFVAKRRGTRQDRRLVGGSAETMPRMECQTTLISVRFPFQTSCGIAYAWVAITILILSVKATRIDRNKAHRVLGALTRATHRVLDERLLGRDTPASLHDAARPLHLDGLSSMAPQEKSTINPSPPLIALKRCSGGQQTLGCMFEFFGTLIALVDHSASSQLIRPADTMSRY
jgi:hypothetical protein